MTIKEEKDAFLNIIWLLGCAKEDGMGLREYQAIQNCVSAIHWSKETHEILLEAAAKIQSLLSTSTGEQENGKGDPRV